MLPISIDKIQIPAAKHYDEVNPAPPTAPNKHGKQIAGVVIRDGSGGYRLVDGYHRIKFLKETNRKQKYYSFFLLS